MNIKLIDPSIIINMRFATPSIEALANTLRQWYASAIVGGLIYGISRAGKSYAIEYIIQKRKEIFGYDAAIVSLQWKETLVAEKDFHERFLLECGHAIPSDRTPNRKLETRLVEYLASLADKSGKACVIVFIDDAHDMQLKNFGYLANIYNRLKKKHIQQYTFLVGEQTLPDLRQKAKMAGQKRYIGRFMCADFEFPLLVSARDLRVVLSQFDTTEYPEASGQTIVQRFLPKASASGWQLNKQATQIMQVYKTAARKSQTLTTGMTMQSCTTIVAALLNLLSRRDTAKLSVTERDLEKVISMAAHLHYS